MATEYDHPVKGAGFTTEYAAAIIVFGSLAFLIMVRRGFRGVNVGGVGVSIK
jgi:hypothetical protein